MRSVTRMISSPHVADISRNVRVHISRYVHGRRGVELRFLFCKVEGGKTVIVTYHGYPRCRPNESMQNDFVVFYQNLLRQRAK